MELIRFLFYLVFSSFKPCFNLLLLVLFIGVVEKYIIHMSCQTISLSVFQTKNIAGMDWKEEDSRTVNLFDEDVIFSVVFIFPLFIHSNTLIANNAILVGCLTDMYQWVGGLMGMDGLRVGEV